MPTEHLTVEFISAYVEHADETQALIRHSRASAAAGSAASSLSCDSRPTGSTALPPPNAGFVP